MAWFVSLFVHASTFGALVIVYAIAPDSFETYNPRGEPLLVSVVAHADESDEPSDEIEISPDKPAEPTPETEQVTRNPTTPDISPEQPLHDEADYVAVTQPVLERPTSEPSAQPLPPVAVPRMTTSVQLQSSLPPSPSLETVTILASQPDEIGALDAMPKPRANPRPPYPASALAEGREGVVILRVTIAADGCVKDASIHTSSGTASMDQSALETVRSRWHFSAGVRGRHRVESVVLVPIRFYIRGS